MLKVLAAALAALALAAACGPQARGSLTPVEGDSFLGPADAKVTVIEYGSPTCPACKSWHDQNWAELKPDYIDTGKIKFVFREFAIHDPPSMPASSRIARCAGTRRLFPLLDEAFARQKPSRSPRAQPRGRRKRSSRSAPSSVSARNR